MTSQPAPDTSASVKSKIYIPVRRDNIVLPIPFNSFKEAIAFLSNYPESHRNYDIIPY